MHMLRFLALSLAVLLAAPAAAHEWDGKQVSALAGELVKALDALLADPGLEAQQATAMQQREHAAAIETARQLRSRLLDFKKRIDTGYDQEESLPFWAQVAELRGDIQRYARSSWLPPETDAKADRVAALLTQLAHYYPADL